MMSDVEIKPVQQFDAVVRVPGSKSYTQRALIVASLADGESHLYRLLQAEDTSHLMRALQLLGASFKSGQTGELAVKGTAGWIDPVAESIYLGNNGTAMRFLTTLAALGKGAYRLTGDPRLCERPIGALLEALSSLGLQVRSEKGNGCPPVLVTAGGLDGGTVRFVNIESSQFVSSVLIAAPYARRDVEIILEGRTVSAPYIEMTIEVMRRFGAQIEIPERNHYVVRNRAKYRGSDMEIEGDASSASYFFLGAAITGGRVRILNLDSGTKQGDIRILRVMEDLGCGVLSGNGWVEIQGGSLSAEDYSIDMGDMPDMVPTVAVLGAFRPGRTQITHAAHLRMKESDRIAALVAELNKLGAQAEGTADGLVVQGGGRLHGAEIETFNDHRIAMSFAIAGLAVPGIKIRNKDCVAKSFPGFWDELDRIVKREA